MLYVFRIIPPKVLFSKIQYLYPPYQNAATFYKIVIKNWITRSFWARTEKQNVNQHIKSLCHFIQFPTEFTGGNVSSLLNEKCNQHVLSIYLFFWDYFDELLHEANWDYKNYKHSIKEKRFSYIRVCGCFLLIFIINFLSSKADLFRVECFL